VPFTASGGCYNAQGMSFAIRPLIKKISGKCQLCQSEVELVYLDSILVGRVCQDCEPFLGAAEIALLAAEFCHPPDKLVYRNP
jgi:hypothetical protein